MALDEKTKAEFEASPTITLNEKTGKWIRTDDYGTSYEYDESTSTWVQLLDNSLIESQPPASIGNEADQANASPAPRAKNKRALSKETEVADEESKKKQKAEPRKKLNTSVYVTGVPPDVTVEEIKEVFTKCGVIMEHIDTGEPKIKIYRDSEGRVKGDALVTYFKPESVTLAIQLLDDSDLRLGNPSTKIGVQEASFKEKPPVPIENKPKLAKIKAKKKFEKLNRKLDWVEDEENEKKQTKFAKIVILKNMYTLKELDEAPELLIELKEDVREECERLGEVTNVILYDKSEGGVISVRYAEKNSADACVKLMNDRYFAGKKISAEIFDGKTKYHASGSKAISTEEEEKEEKARLERYAEWLEGEEEEEDDDDGDDEKGKGKADKHKGDKGKGNNGSTKGEVISSSTD